MKAAAAAAAAGLKIECQQERTFQPCMLMVQAKQAASRDKPDKPKRRLLALASVPWSMLGPTTDGSSWIDR